MNCNIAKIPLADIRQQFFTKQKCDETLEILITKQELNLLTRKVAFELNQKYKDVDEPVHLIGLLTGAYYFLADLTKYLRFRYAVHFLKITSYDNQKQHNSLFEPGALMPYKEEKHVVFVDELIDSGQSMKVLKELIPHALTCACLTKNKPADFAGCNIVPHVWLIGFGLDDEGEKRGWPHLFCKNMPISDREQWRSKFADYFNKIEQVEDDF